MWLRYERQSALPKRLKTSLWLVVPLHETSSGVLRYVHAPAHCTDVFPGDVLTIRTPHPTAPSVKFSRCVWPHCMPMAVLVASLASVLRSANLPAAVYRPAPARGCGGYQ